MVQGETPEIRAAYERCMNAIDEMNAAFAHPADNAEESQKRRLSAVDEYHEAGTALVAAWTATGS